MFERGEQCVNQSATKSHFTPKGRQADVLLNSAGKPTNEIKADAWLTREKNFIRS